MAFGPGSDAVVTLGGTDISEFLSGGDFETERETKELPVLGGNPQVVIILAPKTSGTFEFYYDSDVVTPFTDFMEDPTPASLACTIAPQGAGGDTFSGSILLSNFKVEFPGDDVVSGSVDWTVNGAWTRT